MAEKNLYIGYDENSDELIITTRPKAKSVGFFIDSGVSALLDLKTLVPHGISFLFLKDYFRKKNHVFAKVPLQGKVELSQTVLKQLQAAEN